MRILMDVDGVVLDFLTAALKAASSSLTPAEVRGHRFAPLLQEAERERYYAALSDPLFWRGLKPYPAAVDGIRALRRRHEVVWCTSPAESCPGWRSIRVDLLREHFGPLDMVCTNRKELVINADVLVDDLVTNVSAWDQEHPKGMAWLFAQPYNAEERWYPRGGWEDLVAYFA